MSGCRVCRCVTSDHAKNMLLMTLWCSWILRVGASSLPAPPPPLDPPTRLGSDPLMTCAMSYWAPLPAARWA